MPNGTPFTAESLKFLRGLKRNNDRIWFDERKPVYERSLKMPMLAVIDEINHALLDFAPEYVRTPQKTMMRIYRGHPLQQGQAALQKIMWLRGGRGPDSRRLRVGAFTLR